MEGVGSVGGDCGERNVSMVYVGIVFRRGRLVSTDGAVWRSARDPCGDSWSRPWTPARAGAVWALTERDSVVAPGTSAASVPGSPFWVPPRSPEEKSLPFLTDRSSPSGPEWETKARQLFHPSLGLSREPLASPSGHAASSFRQTSSPGDCPIVGAGTASGGMIPGSSVEEVRSGGGGGAGSSSSMMGVAAASTASSAIVVGCSIVSPERDPLDPSRSGKGCPAATVKGTSMSPGQGHYRKQRLPVCHTVPSCTVMRGTSETLPPPWSQPKWGQWKAGYVTRIGSRPCWTQPRRIIAGTR